MRCAHGNDGDRCSQCLQTSGAPVIVRPVTQAGRDLLIDGAPAGRPIEPVTQSVRTTRSQRKGGARAGRANGAKGKGHR